MAYFTFLISQSINEVLFQTQTSASSKPSNNKSNSLPNTGEIRDGGTHLKTERPEKTAVTWILTEGKGEYDRRRLGRKHSPMI